MARTAEENIQHNQFYDEKHDWLSRRVKCPSRNRRDRACTRNKKIIQAVLFSRLGSSNADAKVGIEPMNMAARLVAMPMVGLLKVLHRTTPITAPPIEQRSMFVHPDFPHFNERALTNHAHTEATNIRPFTASFIYMPTRAMLSRHAHMSHVALAGIVLPRIMSVI